ncbi:MAG: serine/threonine-protein kinase, partial [Sorangiineae bacterium]|nr:serine/threonine-protein kinase [Sorangiineae bacterium]
MAEDVFGIVGSVIAGTYQVEAVVAEGGFGVVYRAHHIGFRAPVALKCLKIPQQLGADYQADFLEQFRAEAELLFRLSASISTVVRPLHVDAVTIGEGAFVPFMALEWLEGETLDAIVNRRKASGQPPISLKKLARLLTPVARALERAHNFPAPGGSVSIVHRDVKPENIFVARVADEQVVKILDFGIGKAKSVASQVAGRASQTHSRISSFTPAYGAPEQWVPKRYGQTGPWTDVWGLALTLVESLAARPIIDGDQAAMMGTALDPSRRPTPRAEGIAVSDAVEAVFARALAVDPRERYAHAGIFWDDLLASLGLESAPDAGSSRSAAARDLRSDGLSAPRVERFEPAPRSGSSHASGARPIGVEPAREALPLDAVGAPSGSSGAAWPAIGMLARSGSGEH